MGNCCNKNQNIKNMKKAILIGTVICTMFAVTACSNNQTQKEGENQINKEQEIVYNESIQCHFFGFTFGDSPQIVLKKLDSIQLYTTDRIVTNGRMAFYPSYPQDDFKFGGYSWNWLYPRFCNNKLYRIGFLHPFKTKDGAVSMYNNLASSLSDRYHMQERQAPDSSYFGYCIGWTKNNQYVEVYCYRYEGVDHEMWYGTQLVYGDNNYYSENSEL
jgi:hypothetical protein